MPRRAGRHGRRRPRPGRGPGLAHPAAGLLHGRGPPRSTPSETAVRLCGQGILDVDPHRGARRSACGWTSLAANPGPVADVLAGIAADLDGTVRGAASLQSADEDKRRGGAAGIEDILRRGNAGRAKVPGKHGAAPKAYESVAVLIGDQPGGLARLFADAGAAGVNIEDVRIEHSTAQQAGLVHLTVEPRSAPALSVALRERGWSMRQ